MLRNLERFNLPEIEEKVLKFWKENKIFEKTVWSKGKKRTKSFVFFEGPPTANGRPGTHHVLARVFKDIILRYKAMRGYFVLRRAGWDTQGLPVEIETEKELGLKTKQDIEKFGIAEFNAKAKESVWKYKEEWEKLTERVGFWLDFESAYVTYGNDYLETLWWIFKQINKRKLLKKSYKIVPYCWRCQTPLSSHELGQPGAYRLIKDPSVFVKLKVKTPTQKIAASATKVGTRNDGNEFLLVWTTTPWTLPANVAVAVNPKLAYKKYKVIDSRLRGNDRGGGNDHYYIWSATKPPALEGLSVEEVNEKKGKELVGLKYEPLYSNKGPHEVYAANFVSAEDGTGLVHIAPAFGEDDFNLMKNKLDVKDIPVTIDDQGRINQQKLPGAGKFIKEADKDIIADLNKRNLIFYETTIEHDYPFCWRCGSPLIYQARSSWFIEISKLRRELEQKNQEINWVPDYVKEGRFGNWLKEAKDWAISRSRYWGTPLPIWECLNCDSFSVIGGLDELDKQSAHKNKFWIMRHGESNHISENILAGDLENDNNSPLTQLGIKQVENSVYLLAKRKIDFIYCSPFQRTKQTCEFVNKKINAPVIVDNRLREINGGVFNNRPIDELQSFFNNRMDRFTKPPEGGESWLDVKKRVADFIKDINKQHNGKNILIISHGDPLWLLESIIYNFNNEESLRWKDENLMPLAGVKELLFKNWPRNDFGEIDLHKPYIDEIELKCPQRGPRRGRKCQGIMKRIPDVADVWFDSGAMPFAQWHYPFENKDKIDNPGKSGQFPADYICEAMDQTRGWFYTLLAISVLLKRGSPYKNVISLGLLVDKNGQKMSKSKGNVVDPWELINNYGADAVRWHFYTINQPGDVKKFNKEDVGQTLRRVVMILLNSYKFWETYADKPVGNLMLLKQASHILDKWIISRFNETSDIVSRNLDKYYVYEAAKEIEKLVDDLSRWHIRRSRKRFQSHFAEAMRDKQLKSKEDWEEASIVLQSVLLGISKLMAPFIPFVSEALYQSLVFRPAGSESVHLDDYPESDKNLIDKDLLKQMEWVRNLASLALAKRAELGIKVRQPLASLKIRDSKLEIRSKELLKILADEVNVKKIVFDSKLKDELEFDIKITAVLKNEGLLRELSRLVQGLRQDANFQPKDKIVLYAQLPSEYEKALGKMKKQFLKDVNAIAIENKKTEQFDAELSTKVGGQDIWISLKKS